MPSMNALVIGAGSIGERHIRALRRIDGVSVSVADTQVNRAMQIAAQYQCRNYFTVLECVPLSSFDAAIVATPADSHVLIAEMCAQAGLHLMVEKPLSTTLDGIASLITTCEQKNLIFA